MFQDETEVVTINGYHNIPKNNEESMLKALAHQPISVAISASGRDFQFYSGVSLLDLIYIYNINYISVKLSPPRVHGSSQFLTNYLGTGGSTCDNLFLVGCF